MRVRTPRVRRNPPKRAATAAEQRRYSAGFGRTFKKKSAPAKKTTAKRASKITDAEKKRRNKREAAFRRAKRAGYGETAAAKRAMKVVPFLKSQKSRSFHGVKAYTGQKTKKRLPQQKKDGKRVAYGKYKRLKVTDPKTGKKKLSYLYKTDKGKRRKIPSYAIGGAHSPKRWKKPRYDKARRRIKKRRATKARSVKKTGGAFTPNRRKTSMRSNKSTKRSRAAKKGWATRRRRQTQRRNAPRRRVQTSTTRRSSSRRATPNRRRRTTATRRRSTTRSATPNRRRASTRRRTVRRNPSRKRTTRRSYTANRRRSPSRARRSTRRRSYTANKKDPKRVAAGKKAARTRARRKKAGLKRGKGSPGRYLKRGKIYYKGKKPRRLKGIKARKLPQGRIYVTNRRRRGSGTRRRGSYRRNQFMGSFRAAFRSAAFVTTGFIGHKALVHGLCNQLLLPMLEQKNNGAPKNQTSGLGQANGDTMQAVVPIVCGGVAAGLGIWLSSLMTSRARTVELGAGMVTSWLHTTIVSLLDMSDQTRKALPYIAGYDTQSTAAAIGRYRRRRGGMRGMRGMRGLGQAGPSRSILPGYAPTGMPGGIQQAVALAGKRGTGEYFSTSGLGEYFAAGVNGIGQYEPSGPMVTQAAAGLGQQVDNGIMPEQADSALNLAEAQAGYGGVGRTGGGGRGMGEYYSARPENGDWSEYRVPTQSQWVPQGPLWAGTKSAQDSLQTSEMPAGVLESASGNGIF